MIKSCIECAKQFPPTRGKPHKFCSKLCRERNWRKNNREYLNANVRAYRKRRYAKDGRWRDDSPKATALKAWMIEIKSKPCRDCKGSFPVCCMDFDHRVGTTKSYNVGSMFAHHYARKLIETELEKCDLVCSNCHRIRTRDRRTGSALHSVS